MAEAGMIPVAELVDWHNERVAELRERADKLARVGEVTDTEPGRDIRAVEFARGGVHGRSSELTDFAGWLIAHAADAAGKLDTVPEEFGETT